MQTAKYFPLVLCSTAKDVKELVVKTLAEISDNTCLVFREKTKKDKDVDYVEVYKGTGCHGHVGRTKTPGRQGVSILENA